MSIFPLAHLKSMSQSYGNQPTDLQYKPID